MVLCPPFPNKEQDTGPIILVIIKLQKIRYTAVIPYVCCHEAENGNLLGFKPIDFQNGS